MSVAGLVRFAADKTNFKTVSAYIEFCKRYLAFLASGGVQATIVSQNEEHYHFFQYKKDGHFNITRPINSRQKVAATITGSSTSRGWRPAEREY